MARQKSVAQQNATSAAEIRRAASMFEANTPSVAWLRAALQSRGIDPSAGILVALKSVPEQEGEYLTGMWLSRAEEFWQFEALVPRAGGSARLERLENVSASVVMSAHESGTGRSFGHLAVLALRERYGA
jgi:hypothetical protein